MRAILLLFSYAWDTNLNMNTMDWDKLRLFHTVAEAGNLTHAGKALGLSQSAISRQISALEGMLGVSLFRRHARGLVLSEQGQMLHETTKEIYEKLASIKGQLVDTHHRPQGPLTVSAPEMIASTLIAPQIYRFKEKYPDIQLTVIFEERVINLNTKQADIAIRLKKPKEADHIQRQLATIHFHICGSKDYFETHGKPKKIEELKNHCLIAFPDDAQAPFPQPNWLYDLGSIDVNKHNNLVMMNSMYAIYRAVREGAGIAVLPAYMIKERDNLEIIFPELARPTIDMYFVYAEERRNSRRIQAFRDFMLENVRETGLIEGSE